MVCRTCTAQIHLRNYALDLSDYTVPTRQHELSIKQITEYLVFNTAAVDHHVGIEYLFEMLLSGTTYAVKTARREESVLSAHTPAATLQRVDSIAVPAGLKKSTWNVVLQRMRVYQVDQVSRLAAFVARKMPREKNAGTAELHRTALRYGTYRRSYPIRYSNDKAFCAKHIVVLWQDILRATEWRYLSELGALTFRSS